MKSSARNSWKLKQSDRLIIATGLSGLGLLSHLLYSPEFIFNLTIGDILLIIAAVLASLPIAKTALSSLRYKIIGIDLLVIIAVIGAIIIGEYWEASAVSILFTFGHYLEAQALNKTRSALESLVNEIPNTARVERSGKLATIQADEVKLDEIVVIKPGEKVPVDGHVVGGNASVNQASVTGESMPVDMAKGDYIYSGSLLSSGFLRVEAEKVGDNTMLANIIELVEEAQDSKASTQVFLERFSTYYTPAIIVLALIVYLISRDAYLALTLLVIACPGALVIAAPVSMVAGIGNAAKNGILVKGGEAIENTKAARVIAFDKTGTLTEGQPRVSDVKTFGVSKKDLLGLAASAEYYSEHPLGKIIVEYAEDNLDKSISVPEKSEVIIGHGVMAQIKGTKVLVGNSKLLASYDVAINAAVQNYIEQQQASAHTTMLVSSGDKIIGVISVTDQLRPGAERLISTIRKHGLEAVMLTGDNSASAKAIASQAGISRVYSELLPADKLAIITKLQKQHGKVIMVGDGVNDAPALATADVGIAIEGAGKDIAMDTADAVLLSGNISRLSYLLSLSRAVVFNMKTNIYFAVGLVIVLLIGVLTENVIMSLGMLIHIASVILVTMNASRLLTYKAKA
ncbi:cation-translocating P-type ATPase [Candidatus Saccharibacteria bacterium]|nr:cation-translocating P-type ATPase [Candidatus Saccharibacteria bacterium]